MCVLAFSFIPGGSITGPELKIISNRDEFLTRPTHAAHWWPEPEPEPAVVSGRVVSRKVSFITRPSANGGGTAWVLGGRDLRAGGSWMAVSRAGRIAILTNYRDPSSEGLSDKSRGDLVEQWVGLRNADIAPQDLIQDLRESACNYAGFNLLLFDYSWSTQVSKAWVISNRASQTLSEIPAGIHGLSNELLNSPWPKTIALKDSLQRTAGLQQARFEAESFKALSELSQPPDEQLPSTGIALERERYLSSVFIQPLKVEDEMAYGTRTSTVLTIGGGQAHFLERSYYPQACERRFTFHLQKH